MMRLEVNDGVSDELPGAMKGDIATAFDGYALYAALRQELAVNEQVLRLAVPAKGVNGFVLNQDEVLIGDSFACDFAVDKLAEKVKLALPHLAVFDQARVNDMKCWAVS
jgi:hypothetical protein